MAKSRRGRGSQARLARPYPLDHTASRSRDPFEFLDGSEVIPPERGGFYPPSVRPLIRTVLVEPDSYQAPPRRGKRHSPLLAVRATFRSAGKATRSPFLNATMVTPQLTQRALECAKRTIRKEVIFATRQTGKGAAAPRRKPRSKMRC